MGVKKVWYCRRYQCTDWIRCGMDFSGFDVGLFPPCFFPMKDQTFCLWTCWRWLWYETNSGNRLKFTRLLRKLSPFLPSQFSYLCNKSSYSWLHWSVIPSSIWNGCSLRFQNSEVLFSMIVFCQMVSLVVFGLPWKTQTNLFLSVRMRPLVT